MWPTFMILIAVHEQGREQDVPSNTSDKQPEPIAPDLPPVESGSQDKDPEHGGKGAIAQQPPEAHDAVGKSKGECYAQVSCCCIDVH